MGAPFPSVGLALGLFFILAALVVFPRTILIIAAGASFGIGAAPIILVAGTAGGTLAFLLSRYIASDWFRRKLKQHPSLEAIAEAVDNEGWRIIALTRLGAPVPSALQNYLYGLTRINLPTFILATLVFSSPQVFLFTFLGATGRSRLRKDQHPRPSGGPSDCSGCRPPPDPVDDVFTTRRVRERVERIARKVMGNNAGIMTDALTWAGTYHGIGARLLREYAEQIGLDPAFTIHDREDSADLGNLVRHESAPRT